MEIFTQKEFYHVIHEEIPMGMKKKISLAGLLRANTSILRSERKIMVDSHFTKSIIKSDEVAFPRGGATALSPLEVKEISNEAATDVLFETAEQKKRGHPGKSNKLAKRHKKNNAVKIQEKKDSVDEHDVTIEHFSFKSLIPGSLVLGRIKKINKLEIVVGIADNLVGYVPITAICKEVSQQIEEYERGDEEESDDEEVTIEKDDEKEIITATLNAHSKQLPDLRLLFSIGQWLQAKVTLNVSERKKPKIQLTIEPSSLNLVIDSDDLMAGNMLQCSVKSFEDHGITLDTGKDGYVGFISNVDVQKLNPEISNIGVGSVILTSVVSVSARTLSLKPAMVEVNTKRPSVTTITSVDTIHPGLVVEALVTKVTKNGVCTKIFGLVDGTLNLPNLDQYSFSSIKHQYAIGSKIKARIIGVIIKGGVQKLILSQLPHILHLSSKSTLADFNALEAFPVGHIFESVEIIGSDPNYFYVSLGSLDVKGQVHHSKIDPKKSPEIDYTVGSKHKARVVGYNEIENLLILSLDPKIIQARYLYPTDVPIGEYVEGEVTEILPDGAGIKVKIFESFEAFVPGSHISDVKLIYPERKFKKGSKVKARILNRQGSKLLLTLKKSLVNSEDKELLSSFDDATIGLRTPATVEKFVHNGAIVSFFGNLKAFLPKNEISETFVSQASDYLRVGQTVQSKILNVKNDEKRLIVTLKQSQDSWNVQETFNELRPGVSIVQVVIAEKAKDSVIVEWEHTNLRGVLFVGHISDGNYEQNRALLKKLVVGQKLEVLVLEKDLKSRTVILTAKKSMLDASKEGKVPTYFKDIKIDDTDLRGYVKSVTNMGLFVAFAGKLTGLVLAKYATDKSNDDLSKKFYKYQSVACRVIRIDEENKRFLLSLNLGSSHDSKVSEAVVNPVDSSKKRLGDYSQGIITLGCIKSVKGTQLNIQLADNLQGRIDITQCFDEWDQIKNKKQPLSQFKKNDTVKVKVIGYHDVKNHKFLPITHQKANKTIILELSMLKRELETPGQVNPLTTVSNLSWDQELLVFINNISKGFVWVSITNTINGRVSFMDLSDDADIFRDLDNNMPIGTALKARLKNVDNEHNSVTLTSRSNPLKSIADLKVTESVPSRILKVKETYVLVELGDNIIASSYITDALNDYSESLDKVFHFNDFATATILAIDVKAKKIAVSLRTNDAIDKMINSVDDIKRGDVVKGFVKNIASNGLYVSLGRSVHGLVRVTDLSDSYLKNWKNYFKTNQMVTGKVSACEEEGRILLTLKESEVNGNLSSLKSFDDIQVGDIFEGSVKNVTDFGVFIKLDGTANITGLCHRSEIADNKVENMSSLFGEGDRVKVKVLGIDEKRKKLSLGMKASYFLEKEYEESQDNMSDVDASDALADGDEMELDSSSSEEDVIEDSKDMKSDDEESVEHDDNSVDSSKNPDNEYQPSGLSTDGFDWTASILDQAENDSSSSDDEDDGVFTREKRKNKKSKVRTEDKTVDMNTRIPQSTGDFERLLVGNPNSSILWMNYMSFQLQLSEVEKAREIADRALLTINYREEQEKLNIWIALLNLENSFGTDESLDEVFKRSCQYMDPLTMHQKLVSIFLMSEKSENADELFKKMCKKFGTNVSVWVLFASSLLDREKREEVREVLVRALQALPKKCHIEAVRKFAQLEFSKGDPEQGRSLFEGLIADAPKRKDLWNVYIDQEIKHGSRQKIEDLFERVLLLKLSKKQAKFFFSKWLSFEETKGDEKGAARIKAKAADYVRSNFKDD